jgi:hypothetical protein
MEKHVKIPAGDFELAGSLHVPRMKEKNVVPVIIICHGFIGSRIGVDRLFVQASRVFASLTELEFPRGSVGPKVICVNILGVAEAHHWHFR